jgi:hypothetical protein
MVGESAYVHLQARQNPLHLPERGLHIQGIEALLPGLPSRGQAQSLPSRTALNSNRYNGRAVE